MLSNREPEIMPILSGVPDVAIQAITQLITSITDLYRPIVNLHWLGKQCNAVAAHSHRGGRRLHDGCRSGCCGGDDDRSTVGADSRHDLPPGHAAEAGDGR